jgi:proteic killer suppression protein
MHEGVIPSGGASAVPGNTRPEAATVLEDLKSPPGNRLEALVADRAGQHSIRVNDQFRICFVWTDTGPTDVEITNHYA